MQSSAAANGVGQAAEKCSKLLDMHYVKTSKAPKWLLEMETHYIDLIYLLDTNATICWDDERLESEDFLKWEHGGRTRG